MLPEVILNHVTRDDVERIAVWLEDEEVSSRWFGHYACGDPVHRGYEPSRMLVASEWEWDRVFSHDPRRFIFSIYDEEDDHIGESQVLIHSEGGAELSLLIGRRDLWHRGYGTSTIMALLDLVFGFYGLERAWVNVPEDNAPALGLFKKLGFVHQETHQLCERHDRTTLNACILAMRAKDYMPRNAQKSDRASMPVLTITGLSGSASEALGAEVARITGRRFIDEEIRERLCQRLNGSLGELEALEQSCRSPWSRMLRALLSGWETSSVWEAGYGGLNAWFSDDYYEPPREYLVKEHYLAALKSVIAELAREEDVVLHGHGSHLFIPRKLSALHVFVTASESLRGQRVAAEQDLSSRDAERWLMRADQDSLSIFRNLFGSDLLDMDCYDLTLNLGRLPFEEVAETLVSILETRSQVALPV